MQHLRMCLCLYLPAFQQHMKPLKVQMNKTNKSNHKKSRPHVYHLLYQREESTFQVQHHLPQSKSDLLLFETGINATCALSEFSVSGCSTLIAKQDHVNLHGVELGAYIKNGFPCGRDSRNKDPDLPHRRFRMALILNTRLVFALYRPQHQGTVIFDQISETIYNIFTQFTSAIG